MMAIFPVYLRLDFISMVVDFKIDKGSELAAEFTVVFFARSLPCSGLVGMASVVYFTGCSGFFTIPTLILGVILFFFLPFVSFFAVFG